MEIIGVTKQLSTQKKKKKKKYSPTNDVEYVQGKILIILIYRIIQHHLYEIITMWPL
jgi:hypothetical protein